MKLLVIMAFLLPQIALAGDFVYEGEFAVGYEHNVNNDHYITPKLGFNFVIGCEEHCGAVLMLGPSLMYSREYFEFGPTFRLALADKLKYEFLLELELKLD